MESIITVNTKLIALLGTPLGHSVSPKMQNAAYAALGLDYLYFPIEVGEENLATIVNAIRVMNFAGFACTTPTKVAVMKYLDETDELAGMMGSVNTVVVKDGKLKGYNTDGYGALCSLREGMGNPAGKTFFCFGAGGAGRAVCFELAKAGVKRIYLSSLAMGEALAEQINLHFPDLCVPIALGDKEGIAQALQTCDAVLNLSGSGMAGHEGETPVDPKHLLPGHVCFDATYHPEKTRFLQEAEALGCKIMNGFGMVLYQGVRQVSLWTGRSEDEAMIPMRKKLLEITGK